MAAHELLPLIDAVGRVLLGKEHQVRLAFSCLLADGHLLIEDRPGMGKSTLAEALARMFALAFKRVSFTSDLLPADLTGLNVFNPAEASFRFQPGPLFTQVLLADEINRASPRTQSALLEAMAAGRVSVDGVSRALPQPFFVIATQNSLDQVGTSPLPEAQLDRFLMRLSLGFPDRRSERAMLHAGFDSASENLPQLGHDVLQQLQHRSCHQHCSELLIDYVLDLVEVSRQRHPGLSPRASQGLLAAARAWSLLEGRDHVVIDDVQAVLPAVVEHRMDAGCPARHGAPHSESLLQAVPALR
ncbi:ATPase AAA [Synechococcus sp. KORDI-52]|uniref:AAA family ATPase n=1 Tax=Synechococcus sp. KORDI-52 TaxID=585425 RepID=UPI0004E07DBF|nr:AAA family ATPase [Synechococcus sp. KORDI-52]AII49224.1 ATPase AAA [Synechococcus sp. KORDI-52]